MHSDEFGGHSDQNRQEHEFEPEQSASFQRWPWEDEVVIDEIQRRLKAGFDPRYVAKWYGEGLIGAALRHRGREALANLAPK